MLKRALLSSIAALAASLLLAQIFTLHPNAFPLRAGSAVVAAADALAELKALAVNMHNSSRTWQRLDSGKSPCDTCVSPAIARHFLSVAAGQCRNNFDSLFITTSGATHTFKDDTDCANSVRQDTGEGVYSSAVFDKATAHLTYQWGGHDASLDNSGFLFDADAAAASINAGRGPIDWRREWDGGTLLPVGTKPPPGQGPAPRDKPGLGHAWTVDRNAIGLRAGAGIGHRIKAVHTYRMSYALGGGQWVTWGSFDVASDAPNSVELKTEGSNNSTLVTIPQDGFNTSSTLFGEAITLGTSAYDATTGCIFSWSGGIRVAPWTTSQFGKWCGVNGTKPVFASLGNSGSLVPPLGTNYSGTIIPSPSRRGGRLTYIVLPGNDNGARGLVNTAIGWDDINGTPGLWTTNGLQPAPPKFNVSNIVGLSAGVCYDSDLGQLVYWDGTGDIYPFTPGTISGGVMSGANWAKLARKVTGDIPGTANNAIPSNGGGGGIQLTCEYFADPDPGKRIFVMSVQGMVWAMKR